MFLHLELTSKCTLKCHACARTEYSGQYKMTELSLRAIENINSSTEEYNCVLLCGSHGDPIYHSQFHEVIALLQKIYPSTPIIITTCGNSRKTDWWIRLAQLLRPIDQVYFSIDGLRESSATYRVNSDWNSILNGIETLKKYGRCQLIWKWIVFKYNESDLIAGLKYAKQLGFNYFEVNLSHRHDKDTNVFKTNITLDQIREAFKNENIPTL